MANRTATDAVAIHGQNPQFLIEKIIRARIYDCVYWKEHCFALDACSIIDKAVELKYIAGAYGGSVKPSPFLCLVLKLLQLQPEKEIILEYIKNEDFRYLRCLGAFYLRLTGQPKDIYMALEPLYNDYRKIRFKDAAGQMSVTYVDEFVDSLLREERVCSVILPRLMKRSMMEQNNELEPRISALQDELIAALGEDEDAAGSESDDSNDRRRSRRRSRSRSKSRSRSRSRDRHHRRSRSRSRDRSSRRRSRSRSRSRDRRRSRSRSGSPRRYHHHRNDKRGRSRSRSRSPRRRDDRGRRGSNEDKKDDGDRGGSSGGGGGGGGVQDMDLEQMNRLRASLGLAPLSS